VITTMRARDPLEAHRSATPLELLFDLTFVVAIAAIVPELAHAVVDAHPVEGVLGYLLAFFAIWWAWMNFTWFASAFDCDDPLYRVLTMVQMAGVLVLAAGVPAAFADGGDPNGGVGDYTTAVIGYVIMRIALVLQWLRAARSAPAYRSTALRYAAGIATIQVLWVVRLFLPDPISVWAFAVFIVAELLVPVWAERPNMTPWHPHHIAERYGLFTIIVLGESVLAATVAFNASRSEAGLSPALVMVATSALVLLFALWWLYFLVPSGQELTDHRERAWLWGYGHYFVFASLAAVGAGIEVATEAITHEIAATPVLVAYSLSVPVAIYLGVLWLLHVRMGGTRPSVRGMLVWELLVVLGIPLLALWLPIEFVVALIAAAAAGLVAIKTWLRIPG
jgi:low temperature requirement protein LtrA